MTDVKLPETVLRSLHGCNPWPDLFTAQGIVELRHCLPEFEELYELALVKWPMAQMTRKEETQFDAEKALAAYLNDQRKPVSN